jgi:hypothetical protein
MADYIFLKSLRILEEFRKNPHVKIPPKSPCANFQNLGKFKNPIFNSEFLFFAFGPADLAAHSAFGPAGPHWPLFSRRPKPTGRPKPLEQPWRNCQKAPLLRVCTVRQRRLLSLVTAMWSPPISSTPFLVLVDPNPISTAPRRI